MRFIYAVYINEVKKITATKFVTDTDWLLSTVITVTFKQYFAMGNVPLENRHSISMQSGDTRV